MKQVRIVYRNWSLNLPVAALSVVAAMCVSLAVVSRAGEHPEHPTASAEAAAKETAVSAGILDDKIFAGEIGEQGKQTGDKDSFVFKEGQFISTACVQYGFNEAPYVAIEKNGAIEFTSEPVNDKSEKMSWKGVVKDNVIEGTALHQTATGQTEYWFKGTLASAASETKTEQPATKKSEHPEHPR